MNININNCKNITLRIVYSARDVGDAVPYILHNWEIYFKDVNKVSRSGIDCIKRLTIAKNITFRLKNSARDVGDAVPYSLHNWKNFFKDIDNANKFSTDHIKKLTITKM